MGKISIFLTNLGKYNQGCLTGEWVKLPIDEDDLESVLARIGINDEYEEYFITDYESMFSNLHINEYSSISDLNTLAAQLDSLADYDLEKLAAVLESEGNTSISDVIELIDDLDSFDLLPGVDSDYAIGEYFAEESFLLYGLPDIATRYFDYESYGRDIRLESNCCVTSYGLIIDNR